MRARWRVLAALALLLGGVRGAEAQAQPSPPPPEAPAVEVTPYGTVFFNGYHNTGGVNNTDVPLWAVAGPGSTGATARQSRLGLRVSGLGALGARLSGVVETDFFGGFPVIGVGDNFGQLRVRLASARLDWSNLSLVLGQDWAVFAPQNPASLACAGIPLFAAGGNPWARLPQVRLERRSGTIVGQLAVLAPSTGDFGSAFLAQASTGMASKLPFFQARLAGAWKNGREKGKAGTVGVSGHYGRSRATPPSGAARDVDSAGVALDVNVPIGGHLALAGEAFLGSNLAGFQAGIFQGLNPDALASGAAAPAPAGIATRGGWAQIGFAPGRSRIRLHAAYGIEDPDDEDLQSASSRDWRVRNETLAVALTHASSAQLSLGVEYRYLRTKLLQSGTRADHHANLAATLSF